MDSPFFIRHSLKARITLYTLVIFVLSIWSLALYASRMLQEDMQRLLGVQQYSTVSYVAAGINKELEDRINALESIARAISPTMLGDPPALQKLLDERLAYLSLFNAGVLALSHDGTAIAEGLLSAGRIGVNYRDLDAVASALNEGRSMVGRPIIGKVIPAPLFPIAVAIRDTQGKVIGALAAAINLGKPNFLDQIAENRYGKTGGYLLVAPKYRLIVTATDKSRIMNTLPAPGINPLLDRFVQGFDGSDVLINPLGEEVLASATRVPAADWMVASVLPAAEAFAPIHDMQRRMLLAALVLTLLAGALTWRMLRRQLAPLVATAKMLATLSNSRQAPQSLPITRRDEIGQLIGGFNRLLQSLAQRDEVLKESEKRFRTLIEWSLESICVHRHGRLLYVNPAAVKLFGARSDQDLIGKRFLDLVHPDSLQLATARTNQVIDHHVINPVIEEKFLKLDGTTIVLEVQSRSIDFDGEPAVQGAMRDITARKAADDRINNLVFYDSLTNLPNRRLLLDRLKQILASGARSERYGALLFIDLDNFKTLNDTLGHDIGDLLLQEAAQRLATCVRQGDTVARLGGDEFVVMLDDLSENELDAATQAETMAENLLAVLNQIYLLGENTHHNTPSVGVTLFGGKQQECIEEPLKRAELAMYQAKAAGRNAVRFFDPKMQTEVAARALLEADLREAVLKGQFLLYYQAQVVGDGRVTGVEALVRWNHPRLGLVSPSEFIPLAEDTGLILPLGQWVLETACAQLAAWAARPEMSRITVAVNVSARQFHAEDFLEQVQAVLAQTGANPNRLKLELTESVLVDNIEDVITKMSILKAQGVGFALDDFGTGYSSLASLKRLPLDQLKIDQSFVRNVLTDPNDAAIAKMVVALAESLGLTVIAEGVEIEAQRDFLARHGCHAYQGYLFSRPLPLDGFEAFAQQL